MNDREFEKMIGFGVNYGQSPTRRMTSTAPSYQSIPKDATRAVTGAELFEDIRKSVDSLKLEAMAFDYSMLERAYMKPDPYLEAMHKRIVNAAVKASQFDPNPRFFMKCTKPRDGTSKTVQIDLETYGSEFFFAGLNSPKDTMNQTNAAAASYQSAESLREQLAAAEAREAAEQAAIERDLYLASLSNLASQTERLINAVRFPSNNRLAFGKAHLKALKALADELGAKIQPTNDAGYFTVLVAA